MREAQKHAATTNETLNYLMYQDGVSPFVTLVRREPISSEIPPAVLIYRESLGEYRLATSERIASAVMWSYLHVMRDAKVLGPTIRVKVGDVEYAKCHLSYAITFKDGVRSQLMREIWVRSLGTAAIVITASFDLNDSGTAWKEIEQIIASITPAAAPSSGS